jgi:hypothetical protein
MLISFLLAPSVSRPGTLAFSSCGSRFSAL